MMRKKKHVRGNLDMNIKFDDVPIYKGRVKSIDEADNIFKSLKRKIRGGNK